MLRRQLAETHGSIRDTLERLRQSQEEKELVVRRKEEVEERLATLETEYEELLGKMAICLSCTNVEPTSVFRIHRKDDP